MSAIVTTVVSMAAVMASPATVVTTVVSVDPRVASPPTLSPVVAVAPVVTVASRPNRRRRE